MALQGQSCLVFCVLALPWAAPDSCGPSAASEELLLIFLPGMIWAGTLVVPLLSQPVSFSFEGRLLWSEVLHLRSSWVARLCLAATAASPFSTLLSRRPGAFSCCSEVLALVSAAWAAVLGVLVFLLILWGPCPAALGNRWLTAGAVCGRLPPPGRCALPCARPFRSTLDTSLSPPFS